MELGALTDVQGSREAGSLAGTGIAGTARQVGAWAWTENRLYEVLGSWAASSGPQTGAGEDDAPLEVYFDVCSQHHAWRAQQWTDRLPGRLVQAYPGDSTPQPPPDLVGPAPGLEVALGVLEELEGAVPRLAVYVRAVLPRVMVTYRGWHRACPPASGRPMRRALALALADMVGDWEEGCDILAGAFTQPVQAEAVSAATARADAAFAAAGLMRAGMVAGTGGSDGS